MTHTRRPSTDAEERPDTPAPVPLVVDQMTVTDATGTAVLSEVSLRVGAGTGLGVVGASGSGKTTFGLAALGVVRPGLRRAEGTVHLNGADIFALGERARRRLRRHASAWLSQDPAVALTPTMPVRAQIAELLDAPSEAAVADRLRAVALPDDQEFQRRLPRELSGGQQRRVAIARALAARPRLVVLDEPTAGLDRATARTLVAEIRRLRDELGFALVLITHDPELVEQTCDAVLRLDRGRPVPAVTTAGEIPARRAPDDAGRAPDGAPPLLAVRELHAWHGPAPVLRGIDLDIAAGESVALLGASGSGKTTLARAVAGLHPPSGGAIELEGATLAAAARRRTVEQRAAVQLVAQDPYGALHPRHPVRASVARPPRLLHGASRAEAEAVAEELLERVGLSAELGRRRPAELSGGQRQRVVLARALAARPRLLVCDEATSALDAPVAAAVLDLVEELRTELGLAVLHITHDMTVVRHAADRVLVLHEGEIVESGAVGEVLEGPRHPVTAALVGGGWAMAGVSGPS